MDAHTASPKAKITPTITIVQTQRSLHCKYLKTVSTGSPKPHILYIAVSPTNPQTIAKKISQLLTAYLQRTESNDYYINRVNKILVYNYIATCAFGFRLIYMRKNTERTSFFEAFYLLLFEPLFFGFTLFLLYNRFEFLIDYSRQFPQYSLYKLINKDIGMNPVIYIVFLVAFAIWMAGKAIQYRKAKDEHKLLVSLISSIKCGLDSVDSKLSNIEKKIDGLKKDEL